MLAKRFFSAPVCLRFFNGDLQCKMIARGGKNGRIIRSVETGKETN
jgi:hypothetical protein